MITKSTLDKNLKELNIKNDLKEVLTLLYLEACKEDSDIEVVNFYTDIIYNLFNKKIKLI